MWVHISIPSLREWANIIYLPCVNDFLSSFYVFSGHWHLLVMGLATNRTVLYCLFYFCLDTGKPACWASFYVVCSLVWPLFRYIQCVVSICFFRGDHWLVSGQNILLRISIRGWLFELLHGTLWLQPLLAVIGPKCLPIVVLPTMPFIYGPLILFPLLDSFC